ncbi:MAG: hypothetical protein AB9900_12330 [Humidesulfovibrio sp.]
MAAANMRQNARSCLKRAKAFLDQGDEASARYACLELRFAIEYIVYQNLQAYLPELLDEAISNKWKPKQVIDEMLKVDPLADKTSKFSFGLEKTYGVPAGEMKTLGEDRRFSASWANKNHNALGNFLHAPALFQINNGKIPTAEMIRNKASEVAEIIEHTLASGVYNINFGVFYSFECSCKGQIICRSENYKRDDGIKCPNCAAIWDIVSETDGPGGCSVTYCMRKTQYTCLDCKAVNDVGIHLVKEGEMFVCACGARNKVIFALELQKEEPQFEGNL